MFLFVLILYAFAMVLYAAVALFMLLYFVAGVALYGCIYGVSYGRAVWQRRDRPKLGKHRFVPPAFPRMTEKAKDNAVMYAGVLMGVSLVAFFVWTFQ